MGIIMDAVNRGGPQSFEDPIEQFKGAMRQRGIIPPAELVTDGKIHRCDTNDGKRGKGDASYLLHLDGIPAGGFQNWRDGSGWQDWVASLGRHLTFEERRENDARMEAAKRAADAERAHRHANARKEALEIWSSAAIVGEHPYLTRKGIPLSGARIRNDYLVIPVMDSAGQLMSVQKIFEDGSKRFLTGGKIAGGYFLIGEPSNTLCIAEGFAAAATIQCVTGHATAVAFGSGNLVTAAETLRATIREARIVICADDDYLTPGNPGMTKAMEAARAVGGFLAVPDFTGTPRGEKDTDFNDLARMAGPEVVRKIIDNAMREEVAGARVKITPTPYTWIEPYNLPARQWLYDHHLIRRFVSLTVAPGAAGKSSLLIADALAMVTGRNLLGANVHGGPKRVWLWNLEDPIDELQRRIAATAIHYGIGPADIEGRLWLDSGRDQGLCVARQDRNGTQIIEPVAAALEQAIIQRSIDVLIVDPFVSSHQVNENDNGAIDAVAKRWGIVADRANCSIELVHHLRKLPAGSEATAEAARGAVSLVAAARSVRVLNRMTKEEAQNAGLESSRSFFRVMDDKNNLAAPADKADWFRMASVELLNGDFVGVVEPWKWPDPFEDMKSGALYQAQLAVDGKGYRANPQAGDWAGHAISKVLDLDPHKPADRSKISAILKTWIQNGAFVVVKGTDEKSRPRPIIEVGTWASANFPTSESEVGTGGDSGD